METQFYHRPGCSKNPLNLGIGNVLKYFTTFTSFTCQSAAESASLQSSFVAGSPLVFRDPGFGLFGPFWSKGFGILKNIGSAIRDYKRDAGFSAFGVGTD